MRLGLVCVVLGLSLGGAGCSTLSYPCGCPSEKKGPKTLLAWEVGPKKADDEDKNGNNEKKKDDDKASNGEKKDDQESQNGQNKNGDAAKEKVDLKGDGSAKKGTGKNGDSEEPEEPKELKADRPDFTEASTTVGLGYVQLEAGYTYSRNKQEGVSAEHSFPDALVRMGLFAEWFELRLGQNYSDARGRDPNGSRFHTGGFDDLYVGSKLALTEQKGYMPESALILFATVPTGRGDLSADRVLPGLSWQYSWEIIKDCLELAGGTVGNTAVDETRHGYFELAQSLSVGYTLTKRFGAFTEVYGIFPHGAVAPGVGPQYYFDGGFTYKFTPDFQVDVRGGVGLNRQSDDYFVGSGFVLRY